MEPKTTRRSLGRLVLAGTVAISGSGLLGRRRSLAKVNERTAVEQAVAGLRRAILGADEQRLRSLVAVQLSYGLWPSGAIQDKSEFIRVIADRRTIYKSIIYSDPTIMIAGSDAIVRHTETVEADSPEKHYAVEFPVLRVWQKQDGRWRLLARQGFKA
jgi:Domain of unknown function (DUF4440)